MKYARVENNKVIEIIDFDPQGKFTQEIEAQFVSCDDTVECNYVYENGVFSKPIIVVDHKQEILNRLAELDKIITRQTEQVYLDTGKLPSYQPMLDAMIEKQSLRQQLQELT